MILNVSGRTDILAFYSKWFMRRYHEGYVDVRNPIYPKHISRIFFKDVDLIVFCTKNPHHIISYLKEIKHKIVFQVTLTAYKEDIEPNVATKKQIIEDIKVLSKIVGIKNLYIRYDPIFLSEKYNIAYHLKAFAKICSLLDGYVDKIIISFIDNYKNVQKNMSVLKIKSFSSEDFKVIGLNFSKIARKHNMTVQTCSEYNNLGEYGFKVEDCLSKTLAKRLTGKSFPKWHSRNNKYCNCVKMVDIGAYNTCNHLCKYCYANFNEDSINSNILRHNPNSSLLIGEIALDDEIKVRIS